MAEITKEQFKVVGKNTKTMETKKLHFETLQLHVGQEQPDPATDEIGRAHV